MLGEQAKAASWAAVFVDKTTATAKALSRGGAGTEDDGYQSHTDREKEGEALVHFANLLIFVKA